MLVLEATALDQRMKLAKLLSDKTLVVDAGLGENPEQRLTTAVTFANALAGEEQVEFEKGAAEDLAEFVAADLMRLQTEIKKLATYAGDRKLIRCQDVSVVIRRPRPFGSTCRLLASRQPNKALEFLERLLRNGEEPLQMLGALTWMYRKLIEASEVRGVSHGYQAARALGMRPEQAEMALHGARKIGKPRLLEGLRTFRPPTPPSKAAPTTRKP